jgi:hypothetical protein
LGRRLTQALVEAGSLVRGEVHEKISQITLADRTVEPKCRSDIEFREFVGDLGDEAHVKALCLLTPASGWKTALSRERGAR